MLSSSSVRHPPSLCLSHYFPKKGCSVFPSEKPGQRLNALLGNHIKGPRLRHCDCHSHHQPMLLGSDCTEYRPQLLITSSPCSPITLLGKLLSSLWDAECLSVQPLSHVLLFATPWTAACQTSLSITNSLSLLKLPSIELVMPSNHLILCHPLLLLPSVFPSKRVFSYESVLRIRWPKFWNFSFWRQSFQ